jgi:hypothetical protein
LKTGALASTCDLFYELTMKKLNKNRGGLDWLHLLAAILIRWRHLVASNKALNLLHWAMLAVLYRRTAAAIKVASLFVNFFVIVSSAVALTAGFHPVWDTVLPPANRHGYWNGWQTRYVWSSSMISPSS